MGVVSCGTTMLDQGVFENIGAVTWDTTVKTSGFTAVSGNGYFCNTTSAAFTVTLPSSPSVGDIVGIKDYANTADTNNITIGRNGSNIQGTASDFVISTEGRSVLLVYVDATKGWLVTSASQASDIAIPPAFITATGGTVTTSGDFKIHTFTGPGTFCVSQIGNGPTNPAGGPTTISYMVIAGGASGGRPNGSGGTGGGGAGGFREGRDITPSYTASPLVAPAGLTITASPFPVSVGGGGAAVTPSEPDCTSGGNPGSSSIFSTITSAGGGGGGASSSVPGGLSGGSGGGARYGPGTGGSGNTPPVSPPQGNNGGNTPGTTRSASGGGGAGAVGSNGYPGSGYPTGANPGGPGGAGVTTEITASPVAYAGGGGGGRYAGSQGSGGTGGGGASGNPGVNGTANTGGGGGGGSFPASGNSGVGGSGIVVIRYKFQ